MAKRKMFSVTSSDCEFQTFRSGGKGGQNQNARSTGVRWIHRPSGAVGEAREHREQHQNKIAAWKKMAESKEMQTWLRIQAAKLAGEPSIDELVEEALDPIHIKIETRDASGRWVETPNILGLDKHEEGVLS